MPKMAAEEKEENIYQFQVQFYMDIYRGKPVILV